MSTQSLLTRTRALQFVASVALLVTAIGVAAEERYLLPVFVTVDGAHGSRFTSYVHILNAGPATIALRGMEFPCVTLCPSRSPSIPLQPYRAVSILAGSSGRDPHAPPPPGKDTHCAVRLQRDRRRP